LKFGRAPESSRAKLQIWQYKPLTATATSDTSIASWYSDTGPVMTARGTATGLSSDTGIVGAATESVTLKHPVLPLLVLYAAIGRGKAKPRALVYLKSGFTPSSLRFPSVVRASFLICPLPS
jgi:hypothetical protein